MYQCSPRKDGRVNTSLNVYSSYLASEIMSIDDGSPTIIYFLRIPRNTLNIFCSLRIITVLLIFSSYLQE